MMSRMNEEKKQLPQGREKEKTNIGKNLRWLMVFCFLVIGGGLGLLFGPQLQASEKEDVAAAPAIPPMPVETTEVRIADSDRRLSAVGTLRAAESVMITAELAARIEKIGFAEGAKVAQGQRLIQLDSAVLQAELDRAVANRDLSRSNYQRAENLFADHAVSNQQRDEAYARWQLDEASVRLASAQLDKTVIIAPFSGTLGLRHVSLGNYVQPGQPLVNLEAIDQLKVEFNLPERYLAEVKTGQTVALSSVAYPQDSFAATVYAINPQVDEKSRSLVVRALLDNAEGQLLPGQFVKVGLSVATRADALFIPEQALIPQPKATLVFKVVDGAAQMVPVETGSRLKGWVEITSGLVAGDVVVTGGHQKIGPGSPVHPLPADPALFAALD
ncbi:MAG: efflux transporter periplasmic adaptor subunit [Desulfuromonas sp.]|nr:MAG: efflux transporter periplasmic adaptor subunit [Desulfuromonas sp.]